MEVVHDIYGAPRRLPRKGGVDAALWRMEHRYRRTLARVHNLEARAEHRRALDAAWRVPSIAGVPVRTCGDCSPGDGVMLWCGGGHALVWFAGCDRPAVWPCVNLEPAK
jgi:hypothetical protein